MASLPAHDLRDRIARPGFNALTPFFRKYPCSGPCSLFHMIPRGAFSPDDMFFYNRIPKAANTTVARILSEHSSYRRPLAGEGDKHRWLRPPYMSRAQVAALESDAVFTFTVVRNPFTRVLSSYQDKILRGPRMERWKHMLELDENGQPSFLSFCRFLDQGGLYRDAHWAPQSALMLLPLDKFDHICKVESLDADLVTAVQRIWGSDGPAELPRAGNPTNAEEKLRTAYCDKSEALIRKLYAADFAAFGYSTELL
ncbi:hypothetical protein BMG00_09455 [Thioclava marina]|uniref:Sulfotransferase family protein n=1 Tax=Thioclava marina TaxID=1915077 RepID=A0ABX3MQZ2_9RHOB|nr:MULTISPECIES: sulfotransferase family protein [Thioclava]MBD3805445.1 sulfotransferase family 2 domain-containing protein [Thioclava sp.]OOY13956.1 hypothetical protein BMG00_09455 [Thioclava marina]